MSVSTLHTATVIESPLAMNHTGTANRVVLMPPFLRRVVQPASTPISVQQPRWHYPQWIERLLTIKIDSNQADVAKPSAVRSNAGEWSLQRIWPHSLSELSLSYSNATGERVAGQWFADPQEFQLAIRACESVSTEGRFPRVLPNHQLLLYCHGVDPNLPGLAPLLTMPGSQLLAHQPGQQATVRITNGAMVYYAKVVRPLHTLKLAEKMLSIHALTDGHCNTVRLLEVDAERGVLILSALSGQSWNSLLDGSSMFVATHAAGRLLRKVHSLMPLTETTIYTARNECQRLIKGLERLAGVAPALHREVARRLDPIMAQVASVHTAPVWLHQDFYDKQVYIEVSQRVGLLGFDGLAIGEAALDLANARVHLELRAIQGRWSPAQARAAIQALMAGYEADTALRQRVQIYAEAARLRLACDYALRPAARGVVEPLLM